MNEYIAAWNKYAVFTGRASRREFWMFCLMHFVATAILVTLSIYSRALNILTSVYGIAVFLPILGLSIRRLHDTNRSGWWLLWGLIPLIGQIVLIVCYAQDSQPGSNQYGPNPESPSVPVPSGV